MKGATPYLSALNGGVDFLQEMRNALAGEFDTSQIRGAFAETIKEAETNLTDENLFGALSEMQQQWDDIGRQIREAGGAAKLNRDWYETPDSVKQTLDADPESLVHPAVQQYNTVRGALNDMGRLLALNPAARVEAVVNEVEHLESVMTGYEQGMEAIHRAEEGNPEPLPEMRNRSVGAKELGAPKDWYNDAQKLQLRESYINLGMSEADADASVESLISANAISDTGGEDGGES